MWQVLKIKLEYHSSPLVVAALCDLFSLTPSLVVETQDYKVSILIQNSSANELAKTVEKLTPVYSM